MYNTMKHMKAVCYVFLLFYIPWCWTAPNTNKYQYLECLSSNVTNNLRLAQEIKDCLAKPVNALYLNVYLDPSSSSYTQWGFSFHSFFVVMDVTRQYVNLLSFHTLTLNICVLRVHFHQFCNSSLYSLDSSEERNVIGTFLFSQYIVNFYESVQLGIIDPSDASDEPPSIDPDTKVMTVEESAFLCLLAPAPTLHTFFFLSFCCKNDFSEESPFLGNTTVYPLACPLDNKITERPKYYVGTAIFMGVVLTIVLLFSNIEYFVPIIYTWSDPVFNADTNVPIFWGKPDDTKHRPNHHVLFTIRFVLKFAVFSFPVIWGSISQILAQSGFLVGIITLIALITILWIIHVCLNDEVQMFILQNIPQPLYASMILRKRFICASKNTKRRGLLWLLFLFATLCVILYIFLYVFWATVILFFLFSGVAANANEAISTVTLLVAIIIIIKTEYSIIKRPIMRVKVLLMNKEDIQDLTWGQVYMLLDKLHWLPTDVVRRRFPLYCALSSTLGLIYFAIKMFSDENQIMSNVIFQSVMMLVVGYIPSLLDQEDQDEYTMLEMCKEIGLREMGDELKAKKFLRSSRRGRKKEEEREAELLLDNRM